MWQGPPPWDLAKNAGLLLALCQAAEAGTVIRDSLKDAAVGLSDDEVGTGWVAPESVGTCRCCRGAA